MGRPQSCPNQWPKWWINGVKCTYKRVCQLAQESRHKDTTLKYEQEVTNMGMWQWSKLWNLMWIDAKSTKQCKHGMQESSKLEASKRDYTMAIQSKPQRAKGNQNSPKAGQYMTSSMLEPSQHKLEQKTKSMKHAMLTRGVTLHLLQPNMAWLNQ